MELFIKSSIRLNIYLLGIATAYRLEDGGMGV
jgi:hypothetical protein